MSDVQGLGAPEGPEIELLQQRVARDPSEPAAHVDLLAFYFRDEGNHDKLESAALAAVEQARPDQGLLLSCAAALSTVGNRSAAIETLDVARGFYKTIPVFTALADALFHDGQYEQFLPVAMESLRLSPWRFSVLKKVAKAHLELKDFASAAFYNHVLALIDYTNNVQALAEAAPETPSATQDPADSSPPLVSSSTRHYVESLSAGRPASLSPEAAPEVRLDPDSPFAALGYTTYAAGTSLYNNIGDEIQSLAAMNQVGSVAAIVKRDLIQTAEVPKKIIMNGWFAHNVAAPEPTRQLTFSWPPHTALEPLFVSFHLHEKSAPFFLTGRGIRYLKQHTPIGCRDLQTVRLLRSVGVSAYFSGCLTLTLPSKERTIGDYAVVCDLPAQAHERLAPHLEKELGVEVVTSTQGSQLFPDTDLERLRVAGAYLEFYRGARFVATSRLHVAMPCIAMGVPVVLIRDSSHDPRFGGLIDLVGFETTDDVSQRPSTVSRHFDIVRQRHLALRSQLVERVQDFAKS